MINHIFEDAEFNFTCYAQAWLLPDYENQEVAALLLQELDNFL